MNKIKFLRELKSYLLITFGLFLNAFAWTAFLIPSKIIGGGLSGFGTLVFFATEIPVGATVLLVNIGLVALAIKLLGANFGVKSIYGILVLSGFLTLLQFLIKEPLVPDMFMCAILGGIIGGAGVGIAIASGGNSGGTDIIALIVNKYYNISPGRVILYLDVVIISSSYIIFKSVEILVYGYIVMAVVAYVIDLLLNGAKQSYQIMIFSSEHAEIADRVGKEIGRGITFLHSKGWYSKEESEVLMIIARKHDKQKIMRLIKDVDPKAFISVAKVMGVFGENFDRLKI